MLYIIAAYITVIIHLIFIIFVPLGGLLALKRRWWMLIHIPAFIYGALISFYGWICPLTPLENWLRRHGGLAGYRGGFIEHYLLPIIYPENLGRREAAIMGVCVLLINLIIYFLVFSKIRGRRAD